MYIDSPKIIEGSAIQNLTIPSGTTEPANPNTGELFYFTDTSVTGVSGLHIYTGSGWSSLATAGDLAAHAADTSLHLTPTQRTFLADLASSALDLNRALGLDAFLTSTGDVDLAALLQRVLDEKADLTGADFSGNLTTSTGKIGVGTTTPSHPITVSSPSTDKINLISPTAGEVQLSSDSTGSFFIKADEANAHADTKVIVKTDGQERVRVTSDGVGIGTTPTSNLTIRGTTGLKVERTGFQYIHALSNSAGNRVESFSELGNPKPLVLSATTDTSDAANTSGTAPAILFNTMGITRMTITGDTGHVGIGREASSDDRLIVRSEVDGYGLQVDSVSGVSPYLTINQVDPVGVNTSSKPTLALQKGDDDQLSISVTGELDGTAIYNAVGTTHAHAFLIDDTDAAKITSTGMKIGYGDPAVSLDIGGSDAIRIPVGNDAQRPTNPAVGDIRFSTVHEQPEYFNGTDWITVDSGIAEFLDSLGGSSIADVINEKVSATGGTFTGNVSFTNGATITGIPTPVNGSDVVNKDYVDVFVNGLRWTTPVVAATTAPITLSGTQTIDGVSLAVNDRVLVKNQTDQTENGIYTVQTGAWTRAADYNAVNEINQSAVFVLDGGSVNGKATFLQVGSVSTLGTDNITFTPFSGPVVNSAGNGVTLTPGGSLALNEGGGITFDGSGALTLDLFSSGGLLLTSDGTTPDSSGSAQLSLSKVGTAGTYRAVTTDAFGRVTAGSNPTTLSGYGITDALSLTGGTLTGNLQVPSLGVNGSQSGVKLYVVGTVAQNVSAVASTSIDWSAGNYFTKTVSGATAFTFTGIPSAGFVMITIKLTNGGSAAVTWPSYVKWPGGAAPTLTAAGVDIINLFTDDGGATVYGIVAGKAMA